jgi:acyl-CoA synthetase (AMP-forming)/AMP-acid ligase II
MPEVTSGPEVARDLGAILRAHAVRDPEAGAFVFLERGEREAGMFTYAGLDLRARAIAAGLQARNCEGERVLIALPSGLDFVAAFFGCLYAGAVPVPSPEIEGRRGAERAVGICKDCEPRLALTRRGTGRIAPSWLEWQRSSGLPELSADAFPDGAATLWKSPLAGDQALAFLQYTSGSTSAPKGVMVTHAALLANLEMLVAALQVDGGSRIVSWLPIFHDMGLVAGVLMPVFAGARSVLLPPLSFLQAPLRWPRAIARYRGTVSGGPSFGFEMCARAFERNGLEGVDLSSWKIASCGAEPVRSASLARFARAFEPLGFRRSALFPCYGLAEATLFASGGLAGEGVVTASHPSTGREVVTCGPPAVGETIVITDPETLAPLAESQIGEILISGPNVAAGYWNSPEESQKVFRARVRGDDERTYLRTGDLGFMSGGRVAIAGRVKDLIIIRGENHHPEDIEASVCGAHPLLATSAGAAFSIDTDAGESLVIVVEMGREDASAGAEIGRAVATRISEDHGIAVHELALIRQLTLPRTVNGKVRRQRCRQAYLADELAWVARLSGMGKNS